MHSSEFNPKKESRCTAIRESETKIRVTHEPLAAEQMEMPQFNYDLAGKKYRYFYACEVNLTNLGFESIYKVRFEFPDERERCHQRGFGGKLPW